MPKALQHHCPQCYGIAKPRCFQLGHLVQCPIHLELHAAFSNCVKCIAAARREERAARKEKLNTKQDGRGHKSEDEDAPLPNKKGRCKKGCNSKDNKDNSKAKKLKLQRKANKA